MTDTESDATEEQVVRFDETAELSLTEGATISEHDIRHLDEIGVLETETETRDGETVVTEARLNPTYLAIMATEFNTSEQTLGSRFGRTRWRAESRLRL